MRASFLAVGAASAVVLLSAFARTRPSSTLHPESLARFEAITSYCETADPGDRSLYLSKMADLTHGYSPDQLAADRNTNSYRWSMVKANKTLAKASPSTGIRGCAEFLAGK